MISRFKKSFIVPAAGGVILLAVLAVFLLISARSGEDKTSGALGVPEKMIIHNRISSLPVDRDTDGFAELWEAAWAAIQSGRFDAAVPVHRAFNDLATYTAAHYATVLEIIYEEPVELDFAEGTVRRLFIDVNNARLFTAEAGDGSFSPEAFPLVEMEKLRAVLVGSLTLSTTFNIVVEAYPEEGGQVTGGGIYREGETVTVEAIPAPGYVFAGWKEDGEIIRSFRKRYQFMVISLVDFFDEATVSRDTKLVAVFEKIEGAHFNRWSFDFDTADIIPRLSPDGEYLLGVCGEDFLLYKFPEGSLVNTFTFGDQYQIKQFHWHPLGKAFACLVESAQQVQLYLVNLSGEKEKIIGFDQAKYGTSTISLEGIDSRVGWIAWTLQGEAVALETRSAEATCLYLVDLEGNILDEEKLAEPHLYLRSPLASGDGRRIAFTLFRGPSGENLWLWELDDGSLRQVTSDDVGDYPFHWVDRNTLMVKMGAVGTGGGTPYALAAVDLQDGSRRMIDHQTDQPHRFNYARSISPEGDLLLGASHTHDGDDMLYLLDLPSGRREVIRQGYGVEMKQVLWQTGREALITSSHYNKGEYYQTYAIQRYDVKGNECVPLVEGRRELYILDGRGGILHYLEANETGAYWIWKTMTCP